jgi:hypothetical protein
MGIHMGQKSIYHGNFIDNISFKLQCKECEHSIYSEDYGFIDSLVNITQHIEKFEHNKFELEIYDFDLAFVKETIDIVKIFEEIDGSVLLSYINTKLTDLGYENIGVIIKNAIKNEILDIDDIKGNETYFALTDFGENLWEIVKKERG